MLSTVESMVSCAVHGCQHMLSTNWAIPEIRCTPPREDIGITKILLTFVIGNSKKKKKIITVLVARVKKT